MARKLSPSASKDLRRLDKLRRLLLKVRELARAIDSPDIEELYYGIDEGEAALHVIRAVYHAEAAAEYVTGAIDHDWDVLVSSVVATPPKHRQPESNRSKVARVRAALSNPRYTGKSNRELAKLLGVDEATIRKYKRGVAA